MIGALMAGWLFCAPVAEAAGDAQEFIDELNSVEMPESPLEGPPPRHEPNDCKPIFVVRSARA